MHIISPSKKKNVLKCKQAKQEMNVLSSVQKSEHFSRLDRYRGPIVCNLIPKPIKDAFSLQLFKQKNSDKPQGYWNKFNLEKKACQITSKQTDFLYLKFF